MFFGRLGFVLCFLYFGVDWKGRVPALTERGLFGFGFCVPLDIALEKRPRSGSDGLWPFLNGGYSFIEEFRSISETFEKKCLGFCGALGKSPRSGSDETRPFLVEEFVVSSQLRFGSFWEFLGD